MQVSVNEIEGVARRAALGLPLPFGLAEEFSRAIGWLASAGCDPVAIALEGLDSPALSRGEPAVPTSRQQESWRFGAVSAIRFGPSLADLLVGSLVAGSGLPARVRIDDVDCVRLLLGYLGAATARYPARFEVRLDANEAIILPDERDKLPAGGAGRGGIDVSVSSPGDAKIRKPDSVYDANGIEVRTAQWRALSALAAESYVASTAASRAAGAGASTSDND